MWISLSDHLNGTDLDRSWQWRDGQPLGWSLWSEPDGKEKGLREGMFSQSLCIIEEDKTVATVASE